MSTHNIGFYEDLTKISLNYHHISSNTHLISSAALRISIVIILGIPIALELFVSVKTQSAPPTCSD